MKNFLMMFYDATKTNFIMFQGCFRVGSDEKFQVNYIDSNSDELKI